MCVFRVYGKCVWLVMSMRVVSECVCVANAYDQCVWLVCMVSMCR